MRPRRCCEPVVGGQEQAVGLLVADREDKIVRVVHAQLRAAAAVQDEQSAAALPAVLKREGRTLVVATHDVERGKAIADRIVTLENGRISAA